MKLVLFFALLVLFAACQQDDKKSDRCLDCPNNQYRKDSNNTPTCVDFTSIDNCADYSSSTGANFDKEGCYMCKAGFYTEDGQSCKAVTKTIDNCNVYSAADKCGTCKDGWTVNTKTYGECIAWPKSGDTNFVSGCGSYEDTNQSTAGLTCDYCEGDKDIVDKKCVAGSGIDNCETDGYYYSSESKKWKCSDCKDGYTSNDDSTECLKYPASGDTGYVENCLYYGYDEKKFSCYRCKKDMAIDSEKQTCSDAKGKTGYIANCVGFRVDGDGVICSFCEEHYWTNDKTKTDCAKCGWTPPKNSSGSAGASILALSFGLVMALLVIV